MRVRNFRLEGEPPPGQSGVVTRFDLELTNLRLNGLLLRRNASGQYRSFAPNLRGANVAHFGPELADRITAAAVAALNGGLTPNEKDQAAA